MEYPYNIHKSGGVRQKLGEAKKVENCALACFLIRQSDSKRIANSAGRAHAGIFPSSVRVEVTVGRQELYSKVTMMADISESLEPAKRILEKRMAGCYLREISTTTCSICYAPDHDAKKCENCAYCCQPGHFFKQCPILTNGESKTNLPIPSQGRAYRVTKKLKTDVWFREKATINEKVLSKCALFGEPLLKTLALDCSTIDCEENGRNVKRAGSVIMVGFCGRRGVQTVFGASLRQRNIKSITEISNQQDLAGKEDPLTVRSKILQAAEGKRIVLYEKEIKLNALGINEENLRNYEITVVDIKELDNENPSEISLTDLAQRYLKKEMHSSNMISGPMGGYNPEINARTTLKIYRQIILQKMGMPVRTTQDKMEFTKE